MPTRRKEQRFGETDKAIDILSAIIFESSPQRDLQAVAIAVLEASKEEFGTAAQNSAIVAIMSSLTKRLQAGMERQYQNEKKETGSN